MPRASSRSSASARVSSSCAAPTISAAFSGCLAIWFCAIRSVRRERDEPLLGAVVQVALQPPALLQARLDDPRARAPQRRLQPLAAHRQARGGGDVRQHLGLARRLRVVDDRADALALELDRRPARGRRGISRGRPSRLTQQPSTQ